MKKIILAINSSKEDFTNNVNKILEEQDGLVESVSFTTDFAMNVNGDEEYYYNAFILLNIKKIK